MDVRNLPEDKELNEKIRREVKKLFAVLSEWNEGELRLSFGSAGCGTRYLLRGGRYCSVFEERGGVSEPVFYEGLEEMIFDAAQNAIFEYALSYELKRRVRYADSRRIVFSKEQEIFDRIGSPYRERMAAYLAEILKAAPYGDGNTCRLDLAEDCEALARRILKAACCRSCEPIQNNVYRILTAYRAPNGGFPDFDGAFSSMTQEVKAIGEELKKLPACPENDMLLAEVDRIFEVYNRMPAEAEQQPAAVPWD